MSAVHARASKFSRCLFLHNINNTKVVTGASWELLVVYPYSINSTLQNSCSECKQNNKDLMHLRRVVHTCICTLNDRNYSFVKMPG